MQKKKVLPTGPTAEEWSLDCSYWGQKFQSLQQLLDAVMSSGMDPNYEILRNGRRTGETAWDLIGSAI